MQISAMWNHQINANLIHAILDNTQGKIDQATKYLSMFETWKLQPNNIKKYEKNKFIKKRCCNHQINLFCLYLSEKKIKNITAIEYATLYTANNGLPFVAKDREMFI
ncbi:hypothetical protein RFI_37765 [Reticulomyxa filosa]|uniref:Uncharacterized protein n=1 Tax=Reticulomyxa filosa TaxID=46433 RepID=X6LE93_RETFI|nr:hypothetical protein RFI_37765 [Reticulomyxa filosa]|eukprot:ETN99705.1 hypothetical protein RFI_37765 [Reticulomyxa filosa]